MSWRQVCQPQWFSEMLYWHRIESIRIQQLSIHWLESSLLSTGSRICSIVWLGSNQKHATRETISFRVLQNCNVWAHLIQMHNFVNLVHGVVLSVVWSSKRQTWLGNWKSISKRRPCYISAACFGVFSNNKRISISQIRSNCSSARIESVRMDGS